jgi:hypothetical protein
MAYTITPVVHGGRTIRYWLSVFLYTLGTTVSAAAFGAVLGALGWLIQAPWGELSVALVGTTAVIYTVRELFGLPIPIFDRRRQVPEWWRDFYSGPTAALLYGLSLGIGFLTFLTFGTFVVVSVSAFAWGSPWLGAAWCGSFGLARGVAVVAGSSGAVEGAIEQTRVRLGAQVTNALALLGIALLAGQTLARGS